MKLDIQLFADGKVVIETDLNDSGFSKGLDKMKSIAEKGFKAIATSVGVVSTALARLVMKSVNAAGELEQQIGGAESVFKDLGATIDDIKFKSFEDGEGQVMSLRDVAKEAYATMGISANDYLATINKMGALMQGAGIETEDALDLSGQAMQRAADIASIMGIDVNSAMDSIAGAAKGNFTMMDNLGVAMNATTIEAYALSKGIKKSYNEMDNATKVGLAMEMFLEKTEYATGNYVKENETFAGSFNTLKAAFSDFLSGAGGLEELTDALISFGDVLITSIGEAAPRVVEGIVGLINNLIPQIPPLLEILLPTIVDGAVNLINGLIVIFPAIINLIQANSQSIVQGAMMIVKTLINTILDMLPEILQLGIDLLVEFVKGIAESADELIPKIVETIIELIMVLTSPENIAKVIEAAVQLVIALITGIIKALPELLKNTDFLLRAMLAVLTGGVSLILQVGWELLKALIKGLGIDTEKLKDKARELIDKLKQWFKDGVEKIKDVGKELITGLWNGIKEKWENLKQKVEDLGQGIVNKFKKVFGIQSPSKV